MQLMCGLSLRVSWHLLQTCVTDLKRGQVRALRLLLESIEAKDGKMHNVQLVMLTGHAGTGKTVAAKVLARVMSARGVNFVQCAYTNSATAELGGVKSFEACIGTAFIRNNKLRPVVTETEDLPMDRVFEYIHTASQRRCCCQSVWSLAVHACR
jgi:hypothetical protein